MTLKLHFHGAARTVTGSCYLIETDEARVLVDCGMFQGSKTETSLNYRAFPFEPRSLHAMLLTHAHIDHTGLIPKLVKHGFTAKIHTTAATADLCAVMLPDSGYIQETEVKQKNERNRKRGLPEIEPIYTLEDAQASLEHFAPLHYKEWITAAKGIRARWWNAGHLLGSASIEVEVERGGQAPLRLLFSGDIGPDNKMLQNDPEAPQGFDYVTCESTYGDTDRFERNEDKRREALGDILRGAAAKQGALLIPSFAVERTQEIIADLVWLMDHGKAPKAQIFIDSPLASKATAIFKRHIGEIPNGEALLRALNSSFVKTTESVDDSKALARFSGFRIIVAASGMCEAGRIRHHLKNHLWQPSTTVMLAGFQAEGSLGRLLENGEKRVRIMGEEIEVRATIVKFEDYSGHADAPELVQWLKERLPITKGVFLTHGEEDAQIALEHSITGAIAPGERIRRPSLDEVYDLSGDALAALPDESKPRISPANIASLDSHNELTKLIFDIQARLRKEAGEKNREKVIRHLRRALEEQ